MAAKHRNDYTELRAKILELASRPSGVIRTHLEECNYPLEDTTIALRYITSRGLLFSFRQPNSRVFVYFTSKEARDKYAEENFPVGETEHRGDRDVPDDLTTVKGPVTVDFTQAKFTTHPWSMSDPYRTQPQQTTRKGALDFKLIKSLGIDADPPQPCGPEQ